MTKIDRKFIPSIIKHRNNGATYQELAIAMKCSISGIRKVIKQNDFTLIEEILIASFTPEQRISVAYRASLVHDDLIKQYLTSYFDYVEQVADLQQATIETTNKMLESLTQVMNIEFNKKSINQEKYFRAMNKAVKSLNNIIGIVEQLSSQVNFDKLSNAITEQQIKKQERQACKETSFIMESSSPDDHAYNDNIDVIDVAEFEKQNSSCMMAFLHGWSNNCKLSYNGEIVGAIIDIKLLNKLQKIGAI